MSSRKPSSITTKIVATFAIAALSLSAFAGRYWRGATDDALFSNTENWATSSGGAGGNSYPGQNGDESTTYYRNYLNGLCVIDGAYTVPGDVDIGTASSSYFVWRANASTSGITTTGNFVLGYDAKNPNYLEIDGGTYSFGGTVRTGYYAGDTVGLVFNGDSFTGNKVRVSGGKSGVNGTVEIKGGVFSAVATGDDVFMVCDQANTKGTLVIEGGTLNTTNGNQVCIGGVDEIDAKIYVNTGGVWNAKVLLLGGKRRSTYSVTNSVTKLYVNGGTLNLSGENGIGYANGDGSYAEMIVNDGEVNCNYGYFYLAERAAGALTINGGTFTMTSNSDGGLTLGRNTTEPGTLTLNGGVLATSKLRLDKLSTAGSRAIFNGGTLKALNATTSFINASDYIECVIKDGGLVVDTDGYDITIKHAFVDEDGTAAASSTKIGTITKKGKGKLTLSEAFPADKIIVQKGTVSANGTTYEATNETSNQSRYWLGATQDTLVSDTANWASAEGGAAGASSIDTDYLGKVYFPGGYTTGEAVFDSAVELANTVSVGAATATPLVWSATVAANGFDNSTGDMILGYDASHATANLKIDSGTYSSSYLRLGYTDNADAELVMNGGSVTMAKGRVGGGANGAKGTLAITNGTVTATGELYVLAGNKTGGNGELVVNGGTLVTTAPDYVRVGETGQNATGTLHMVSGTWNTKSFLVGGAKKKTANSYSGMGAFLVVDGGTIIASADSSIGANVAADARSEMIINNGNVNINANVLYVGDGGPGYLTINGGNLTMKDSDYGVSLGHIKGDGTGGDPGIVTLNGGTLTLPKFRLDYIAPGSKIVFNGTTLVATRTQTDFLNATDSLTCEIQSGNLIIDTAGYDVTIAHDLTGVGGVVKKGLGALHLTGNNTFTGEISVQAGTVDDLAIDNDPASYTTALGVTEDGQDLGTVQLHRSPLSLWLADEDFETYTSTYGAKGTESKETPRYIAVGANGVTNTYINLNTASNVTGTVDGKAYSFTTEDVAPRTLRLDYSSSGYAANVRDVGSWPLQSTSGKKMNQDVILRGGNLDGFATASSSYKTDGYLTKIGLKTEIDLRRPSLDTGMADGYKNLATDGTASSFAAENCTYYRFDLGWRTSDGTQIGADDNGNFTNQIRKVFSTWGTAGNLPSYFHCQIGTDRTGVTGLLLLGLMGVEEEVLYRDYLMSNFANIGGSRDSSIPETFIMYLLRGDCNSGKYAYTSNDATYGRSIASRVRQYLEMCGVTAEEIGRITQALSGETPAEVLARVDAYETANEFRTVSYVSYPGSSTTNAIHRFGTNGKRILPRSTPSRDGYTFLGWDVDHETVYDATTGDSVVYALWKNDSVTEPREFYWDNNAGTSTMSDGGNWYVKETDPKVYDLPTEIDKVRIDASLAHPVLDVGETFSVTNLYVGRSSDNYPVLNITNGTLNVGNIINLGEYGAKAEMNVYGGDIYTREITVGNWGSHDYNKLNVYGGNITISGGNWPGALNLGKQTESRGDVLIKGGTVTVQQTVNVGFSNLANQGGPSADYNSSIVIDGGELAVTAGNVEVANADGAGINGGGYVRVANGNFGVTNSLNITVSSNGWGQVDVLSGGTLTVGDTIRVGNNTYAQHAVLNVAGGTVDVKSLSVARECDAAVYLTDGGTISVEELDHSQGVSANATFYVDGGTVATKKGWDYFFANFANVIIGTSGFAIDSNGFNSKMQAFPSIEGIGGLTKKGEGRIEIVGNSWGYAGSYNAHGVISVEAGTLKMPSGQTFYVEGTNVAEGATLDLNGSTLVIVTKSIEDATWTNATGDRDATNPANWSTVVKYYGEDGKEIEAIRVTLDGVLPAATSDVRIPIDSDYPTNLDPATVKSVTYVSSRDMSLILDFAATYDNYAAPSIALSGDVKILSNFNALLNSAAAWYDPSDHETLEMDVEGNVTSVANKGYLGETMDATPYKQGDVPRILESATITVGGNEFAAAVKGNTFLVFTNNYGFASSGKVTMSADQKRSLFAVAMRSQDLNPDVDNSQTFPVEFQSGSDWSEDGLFNIAQWPWGTNMRIGAVVNGESKTLTLDNMQNTENRVIIYDMISGGQSFWGHSYSYDNGSFDLRSSSVIEFDSQRIPSSGQVRVNYGFRQENPCRSEGLVGEALAFSFDLSDTATAAVRQYLAAKWLEGDAVAPSAGTTSFDTLILEGANVDMDGAAVSVGVLGGSGEISNATSLRVTGFAFDLADGGEMPRIVANCPVNASDATVVLSEELMAAVHPGDSIVVFEAPGNIAFGGSRHISSQLTSRRYVVRPHINSETTTLVLTRDGGFALSVR